MYRILPPKTFKFVDLLSVIGVVAVARRSITPEFDSVEVFASVSELVPKKIVSPAGIVSVPLMVTFEVKL